MERLTLPESIHAGDTIDTTESLADYPASDGWSVRYVLVSASNKYEITSSANGDDHDIDAASATTATWAPGQYTVARLVEKSPERYTHGTGYITINPDVTVGPVDRRHHVEKVLDAIESILEGKAAADAYRIEINNKTLQRYAPEDLLVWRDKYRSELREIKRAQRVADGMGAGNRVNIRFRG